MAFATTQISNVEVFPEGDGLFKFFGKFTLPASYGSGGDAVTVAKCKAAFQGISNIKFIQCTPAFPASGAATALDVVFEPINDGTNAGKFHVYNSMEGHTHDIKAIGGLTLSETLCLDASQSFGKNAATNRTIVGSTSATTGGVVATAADTSGKTEIAAATDLSTKSCWFVGWGTE